MLFPLSNKTIFFVQATVTPDWCSHQLRGRTCGTSRPSNPCAIWTTRGYKQLSPLSVVKLLKLHRFLALVYLLLVSVPRCAPIVTTGVFVSALMTPPVVPAGHSVTTSPCSPTGRPVRRSQSVTFRTRSRSCARVPSTTTMALWDPTAGTWPCDGKTNSSVPACPGSAPSTMPSTKSFTSWWTKTSSVPRAWSILHLCLNTACSSPPQRKESL